MRMLEHVKRFARSDDGTTAIEYALIASIVSISIAAAVTQIKVSLQNTFTKVQSGLDAATN